jgi:hypothetical protein
VFACFIFGTRLQAPPLGGIEQRFFCCLACVTSAGDYLGEREDFALKVMHAYVDGLDFSSLEFDTAIRTFLQVGCDGHAD